MRHFALGSFCGWDPSTSLLLSTEIQRIFSVRLLLNLWCRFLCLLPLADLWPYSCLCVAQVVRWVRSFPFAFLTDREYVLGRRVFRVNDSLYGITKSVEHPSAPINSIIRIQHYHSMWRCRTSEASSSTAPSSSMLPLPLLISLFFE